MPITPPRLSPLVTELYTFLDSTVVCTPFTRKLCCSHIWTRYRPAARLAAVVNCSLPPLPVGVGWGSWAAATACHAQSLIIFSSTYLPGSKGGHNQV